MPHKCKDIDEWIARCRANSPNLERQLQLKQSCYCRLEVASIDHSLDQVKCYAGGTTRSEFFPVSHRAVRILGSEAKRDAKVELRHAAASKLANALAYPLHVVAGERHGGFSSTTPPNVRSGGLSVRRRRSQRLPGAHILCNRWRNHDIAVPFFSLTD
jgi:hypothetical protein